MRHKLFPFLLILVGLGFVIGYILLTHPANRKGQAVSSSGLSDYTSSEDSPVLEAVLTSTPQPIFPTPTIATITSVVVTVETPQMRPELTARSQETLCKSQDCQPRFGVSGRADMIAAAFEAGLPFGTYLTWFTQLEPPLLDNVVAWQMVPLQAEGPLQSGENIREVARANLGSNWIIGNEPDVIWQDNITPERYAELYYEVYHLIKEADPTAQVAIAGVAQPTKLRRAYLDRVLDTYQATYGEPMPVDIWTVHAFVLREEAGSWGVDIPPGLEVQSGELYEVSDHDNLDLFRQNIIDFRAWMADRGYRDRPLAITEFGILHPADYGFPPAAVAEFMVGAFDFLMTAANETGYPSDDNKLVQWWFWYSVFDGGDFPTGNLFDPDIQELTTVGKVFADYVAGGN